jgi:hypothetical protein
LDLAYIPTEGEAFLPFCGSKDTLSHKLQKQQLLADHYSSGGEIGEKNPISKK